MADPVDAQPDQTGPQPAHELFDPYAQMLGAFPKLAGVLAQFVPSGLHEDVWHELASRLASSQREAHTLHARSHAARIAKELPATEEAVLSASTGADVYPAESESLKKLGPGGAAAYERAAAQLAADHLRPHLAYAIADAALRHRKNLRTPQRSDVVRECEKTVQAAQALRAQVNSMLSMVAGLVPLGFDELHYVVTTELPYRAQSVDLIAGLSTDLSRIFRRIITGRVAKDGGHKRRLAGGVAILWHAAGRPLTTTKNGAFDRFFADCREAAFGKSMTRNDDRPSPRRSRKSRSDVASSNTEHLSYARHVVTLHSDPAHTMHTLLHMAMLNDALSSLPAEPRAKR